MEGDEDADVAADVGPWPAPSFDPGWRGRPMMLAALGAAVLSRRAFRAAATDDHTALEMQVLAALALREDRDGPVAEGMGASGIAWQLAARPEAVSRVLGGLARLGLIEAPYEIGGDVDEEDLAEIGWVITDAGRDRVMAWSARIVPLFGGWPPVAPDPDDAG